MKIVLGGAKGGIAIVSESDYKKVSKHKWTKNEDGYLECNYGCMAIFGSRFNILFGKLRLFGKNGKQFIAKEETEELSKNVDNTLNKSNYIFLTLMFILVFVWLFKLNPYES